MKLTKRSLWCIVYAIGALSSLVVAAPSAQAANASPHWSISSLALPTSFSATDNAFCEAFGQAQICDSYVLTATNVGGEQTSGSIVISDALPPGLKAVGIEGHDVETRQHLSCSVASLRCEYSEHVLPGDALIVKIEVEITSAKESVLNAAAVEGGNAVRTSTSEPLTVSTAIGEGEGSAAREVFGLADFGLEPHAVNGAPDEQAGDHLESLVTTFHIRSRIQTFSEGDKHFEPAQVTKDISVDLSPGFIGNPQAAAKCTETELTALNNENTLCPVASRVGRAMVYAEGRVAGTVAPQDVVSAVYNMVPDAGYPAQFGFTVFGKVVPLYANLVHTASGYVVRVTAPGIPRTLGVYGAAVTFFGDPQAADGDPSSSQAFFTNPGNCTSGPLSTRFETDSWAAPGQWSAIESVAYPQITGCNLLQFEPGIEMHPDVTQAEEPSGYEIKIKVPQSTNKFPVLATPYLKNVTMTLPAGMMLSAGAGDGLSGCAETGPNGIDMPGVAGHPNEAGEGEAIGPDGMAHLTRGHCPASSQIGTMQIVTPLLEKPLEGRVYVAQPPCGGTGPTECTAADAMSGRLFGIYLEAEGSGVVVKLKGSVSVSPTTGQVTARFTENPQVPFSEVSLHLKGGGRAPLANPRQCGEALLGADLTPWSSPITPDVSPSAAFPVSWDGGIAPCPATLPFAPTLTAGSVNTRAGAFGPLTLTLNRGDRQQDISSLQVHMPVGLLGMLSKVPLCEEPQASQGTCSEASEIGTTTVEAGSGPQPLGVQGRAYLTGPYGGAPFGLTIVVPAIAGPFNLGNVVVRSRISVDQNTSALTVTSDPLPQFRDGVPLRIQTLNVTVDRPGFIFNPTNCAAKQVTVTVDAEQGASANLSTPFAVEGCKNLPFKPTFKVSTSAKASKALGASLDVKVGSSAGQANIARVAVTLPKQLPARLTTLQHACPAAVFANNPATCDPASLVGMVKARSAVLPVVLRGPAYLVSHGGEAFPDLVVVLQGEGVRIDLTGKTKIAKGLTSSTFTSVPDAPIESFELQLPQGKFSALTSNVPSLCGQKLAMPTTFTGQNGTQFKQSTKIAVSGCPRAKPKKKAKKARRRA